jgi:hypothetical protein
MIFFKRAWNALLVGMNKNAFKKAKETLLK